jgi:methylmalonyl-CoA carboxyltransferase small subunit
VKLRITIDGRTYEAEVEILEPEDSGPAFAPYAPAVAYPPVAINGGSASTATVAQRSDDAGDDGGLCLSPVTGLVIKVNVEPGQAVGPGDLLLVLEAMKMENQVTAKNSGVVKSVNVAPGNPVRMHQVLIEFE